MTKQIQWFPGHIAKTLKEFQEISNKLDYFIILLDARAPKSTFIEEFNKLVNKDNAIILITKSDLVNKDHLAGFINEYKNKYKYVFTIDTTKKNKTQTQLADILKKVEYKNLIPKLAIIGVPNVGKSTLLNIIISQSRAKVEDRAGVTRQLNWYQFNNKYWILDTPGVLQPKFESKEQPMILSAIGSIKLEILPLHLISAYLIEKLNLDADKLRDAWKITDKYEFDKKVIKDFQHGKFGRIILD